MQQQGEYTIAADIDTVWAALNDAEVLGRCITGCQHVEKVDETHFDVKVKAKVGPVSASFQAALELLDLNPPQSYTIQGNVKGGAAGFGKGAAKVQLSQAGEQTLLSYSVDASVGGKLAQVGSRLVDGAARKMADEFFAEFSQVVSQAGESQTSAETNATAEAAYVSDEQQSDNQQVNAESTSKNVEYEQSGSNKIWLIAFGVLLLAVLLAI